MDSFLFCLILVAVIAFGGREQRLIAQLSDRLADRSGPLVRRPFPLLAGGIVCAILSAGVMTYAGLTLAKIMPARAAQMLVALALAIAAFELFWPVRLKPAREPTRSVGAIALVIVWRQLGDAARFVIFAFAVQATYPLTALIGGGLGGAAAVVVGWTFGDESLSRWPLRTIRIAMGVLVGIAAIFIGIDARYGID